MHIKKRCTRDERKSLFFFLWCVQLACLVSKGICSCAFNFQCGSDCSGCGLVGNFLRATFAPGDDKGFETRPLVVFPAGYRINFCSFDGENKLMYN